MTAILHIIAAGLDLAAVGVLVFWSIALARLLAAMWLIPTARAGVPLSRVHPSGASVCIVIPAHNEEAVIEGLIRSIRAQTHPRFAAVLCLDRCTDSTRERAAAAIDGDPRLSILDIAACPDGWAGKVNAAWAGAQSQTARKADLLLFVDADTTLAPDCLAASVALLENRRLDLLSLLSTLSSNRWFELVAQPSASLELVRQYPVVRANRRTGGRPFANGQHMLFRREAYDTVGGHAAVKDELLEDLALARAIGAAGLASGLFFAHGMLTCRMYDSWSAFRTGWKRIFIESTRLKIGRLRKAAVCTLLAGGLFPVLTLVNVPYSVYLLDQPGMRFSGVAGLWLSGCATALWVAVVGITYRVGRVPLWAIPAYPLGSWLMGGILLEAIRDLRRGIATKWGGRTYTRTPR